MRQARQIVEVLTDPRQKAEQVIRAVYRLPGFDASERYDLNQVWLWAKNDRVIQDMLGDEDEEDQIHTEVKKILAAAEDRIFKRRATRFASVSSDKLGHVRHLLKGLSWPQAKRKVWALLPGGAQAGAVDDETAEGAFRTLVQAAGAGMWRATAAHTDQAEKAWRLSTARVHQDGVNPNHDPGSTRKYEQTIMARYYFPAGVPEKVKVYRGVPRPDATLRPGDYATLDRDFARGFMRGRHGIIVTAEVKADDLLVMRADPGSSELIYWPRGTPAPETKDQTSYLPAAGNEGMTLRQLWQEVNA